MGRHGWERKGSTYSPTLTFSWKGCFQLSWGKGGGCLLVCKNPSFQHLWAEVTFLSPSERLQAFSPFPLILGPKSTPY